MRRMIGVKAQTYTRWHMHDRSESTPTTSRMKATTGGKLVKSWSLPCSTMEGSAPSVRWQKHMACVSMNLQLPPGPRSRLTLSERLNGYGSRPSSAVEPTDYQNELGSSASPLCFSGAQRTPWSSPSGKHSTMPSKMPSVAPAKRLAPEIVLQSIVSATGYVFASQAGATSTIQLPESKLTDTGLPD